MSGLLSGLSQPPESWYTKTKIIRIIPVNSAIINDQKAPWNEIKVITLNKTIVFVCSISSFIIFIFTFDLFYHELLMVFDSPKFVVNLAFKTLCLALHMRLVKVITWTETFLCTTPNVKIVYFQPFFGDHVHLHFTLQRFLLISLSSLISFP